MAMRLFTAILFSEDIKDYLSRKTEELKNAAESGGFTARDNLHLTVNFIGETKRLEEVKQAMRSSVEKLQTGHFLLSIGGFGRFKRREGDICWIGVEKEVSLWKLQKELVKELKEAGFFEIDDMEYTPHLTLGRRIKTGKGFNEKQFEAGIVPMQMEVSRLSLMKSERIDGRLVYTEIYNVELK